MGDLDLYTLNDTLFEGYLDDLITLENLKIKQKSLG